MCSLNNSKTLPCFKQKKYLIVTTSGGGGHLQAAQAKKEEILKSHPNALLIEKNIVQTAGGKILGKFMIDWIWNTAQRNGSVKALDFCAYSIPLFDFLFWIPVFFQVFRLLIKEKIDDIIDTQPMATSAIVTAVYLYSKLKKRKIYVDKILTELPTIYSCHYLKPIKKLRSKNRELVRLITIKPLLKQNQTEEDFWHSLTHLGSHQIIYDNLPIREFFKKKPTNQDIFLPISYKTIEEKTLLQKCLKHRSYTLQETVIDLEIKSNDLIVTIMLGSQPMQQASIDYVKTLIDLYIENKIEHSLILFVFCSDKKYEPIPLQKRIYSLLLSDDKIPLNLTIVPMSSQSAEVIAPLYSKSLATITKAGGITSMELLTTSSGKIWIHHEDSDSLSPKGMPRWEYGNVLYLQKLKGASLISPSNFKEEFIKLFNFKNNSLDQEELQQTLSSFY